MNTTIALHWLLKNNNNFQRFRQILFFASVRKLDLFSQLEAHRISKRDRAWADHVPRTFFPSRREMVLRLRCPMGFILAVVPSSITFHFYPWFLTYNVTEPISEGGGLAPVLTFTSSSFELEWFPCYLVLCVCVSTVWSLTSNRPLAYTYH